MTQRFRLPVLVPAILAVAFVILPAIPVRANSASGKKVHIHGLLIDMTCWNDRSGNEQQMLREHTKRCLQMPDCIRSGYAVVTGEGKVYKMDQASNEITTKWIAATQKDAGWQVDVKGRLQTDGALDVSKIELQR